MSASISLIGVPYDLQSSFMQGAADAPEATREAYYCESANLWSETGYDLSETVTWADSLSFAADDAYEVMEKAGEDAGKADSLPIFIGGDHSVTYPLIKGMHKALGDFDILHFDAHPDCYHEFEGNPLSHACPFSRIMEEGLCKRLVSVGIRTASGHQREQRDKFGIEWLEMREHRNWPTLTFERPVYITFDMDTLDPSVVPGVSHHEPGGMSVREALDVIHAVNVPIIGADIVELNPTRDINDVTAMVTAKFIREIAGMMLQNT